MSVREEHPHDPHKQITTKRSLDLGCRLRNLTTINETQATQCQPPLVVELHEADSIEYLKKLAGLPHTVFFDSAQQHDQLGRYSYLAVDPFDWFTIPVGSPLALDQLQARIATWQAEPLPHLPPWQGGAAGLISYDIGRCLEKLAKPRWDEFQLPALAVGIYDLIIAFDHQDERAWAISHGFPESAAEPRKARAENRMHWLLAQLESEPKESQHKNSRIRQDIELLAPSFKERGLLSNFSRDSYLLAIKQVIKHLRAGDVFQVNLSQRLLLPEPSHLIEHYLKLRNRNAAPFGGYFQGGDWQILSASPERFVQLADGMVETRPIKGTRPRGVTPDEDCRLGEILRCSKKDRAENVMIVDLLRNDLSRVCTDDSVVVTELFGLERYSHVQHLVSVIQGELKTDCNAVDLLKATLPGGSITGAPKVSAQQIIAKLEPTARGPYCGSLFMLGFTDPQGNQFMDSNILIRTLIASRGWLQAPVGGGITIASDPLEEYEETWHKAAGLVDV